MPCQHAEKWSQTIDPHFLLLHILLQPRLIYHKYVMYIYIYPVKMNIHINNSQLYKWLILHFPLWKVSIYKHQKLDEKLDNHTTLNPAAQGLKLCPAQGRCFSCTFQWWPRQDLWHWLRTQNKCREFVFRGARSKVGEVRRLCFLLSITLSLVLLPLSLSVSIIIIIIISYYHH